MRDPLSPLPRSRRARRRARRVRWWSLVVIVAVAFVGYLAAVAPSERESAIASRAGAAPHFYVVGSDIVAPDGSLFYPVGANVGMQSNFDWKGTAVGHVDAALAWGWNTIRLTFYCTDAYAFTLRKTAGYDALLAAIDGVVREYTSRKIVVMLECHDAMVNQTESAQFWVDMATRYRDNPYVWFNPLNEPTWNDNDGWLAIQSRYLRLIRATGAENVFVADVQNSGNDAGWDGARRVYDDRMGPKLVAGQCNVVFSQHEYGGVDDNLGAAVYWERVKAAGLAMLVGEFGYTIDGSSTAGSYAQNVRGARSVFADAPKHGIGALWWHGTHGDGYSLMADGGPFYEHTPPTGLSEGGRGLYELAQHKPDLGRFNGDLAQSHCPSAG